MKKHMLFFLILAVVVLMTTQGCSFITECGGAINEGGGSESYQAAAYGANISVNGTTLYGTTRIGYAQVTSLTASGTSAQLSTHQPGGWRPTKYQWSNSEKGSSIWISNSQWDKTTDVTRTYSCTITFHQFAMVKLADGSYREQTVGDPVKATVFFKVQHCGKAKR